MSGLDPRFMQHIVVLLILSRQGSMGGGGGEERGKLPCMHACMMWVQKIDLSNTAPSCKSLGVFMRYEMRNTSVFRHFDEKQSCSVMTPTRIT